MRQFHLRICIIFLSFISASIALALDPARARITLTVHGSIGNTNTQNATAEFDQEMLSDLGTHTVRTDTPWTSGINRFEGPLARDLLMVVDARGTMITARALNDYHVKIPISDFLEYDVILATHINGNRLSIRERGPIWIIYPWHVNSELKNEEIYTRSIWQLSEIEIE